ncbi:ABC transporter [bacterium (Candidatus Blackallbacteria) CG17_big_fil_post_rev_8_21_14_2_50_48_46]|uniref:ABC transporter n=1 Tax=bacterium (Candidatus Blackallbacteria) CG17_big_fil_post_rev_8_21_14_2_50_48_46 TaxID=2014261 RepID=A0A2M7G343_9BACT|nr:MAG: ABC transporter [bacterium (Candidatus Blackallbacteria) CG18_big_fil_WC_8_21_14_2_50_49_26]PIW16245.1 MAG: ABC transporter [bacterium (Candidatus Blackallbacteria) CG17_big_fil_post_rev_8_21_14_2_50_48_46]PIW49874.1 MAG: ABC transporter [bacterium (Candidatus Blackallbacteria) CG13_big_fil_rev_8_21_14_2_50_49_14]
MPEQLAEPLFKIEHLSKSYVMGEVTVHALRDVSLEIYPHELLVILGASGSGKSTLLNIVGGMDTPTSGTVWFKGEDLSSATEKALTRYRRNHIGFVFQFYNLIPNLTALENVEMATEIVEHPAQPLEMLRLVGLDDRADHFPGQLSGGQQQRVAIARATAKQPEVLLCDEPTGALDYQTGKTVLHFLQEINRKTGTTLVLITHNAGIAAMANRVIHMRDGEVQDIQINPEPVTADQVFW